MISTIQLAEDLIILLDKEQDALRNANLDVLKEIAEKKEVLANEIKSHDHIFDRRTIETIALRSEENSALFGACIAGLKSGLAQISEVRTTFGQLKTYNIEGTFSVERTLSPSISKKA